MTTSWRELLAEAKGGMPAREARWLVEEVSGWEGPDLPLHLDDPVAKPKMDRFHARLARRLAGEPIQYVLGHWAFRHLDCASSRQLIRFSRDEAVKGKSGIQPARVSLALFFRIFCFLRYYRGRIKSGRNSALHGQRAFYPGLA